MASPHGSFIWYELLTPDPDASAAFYARVTGWAIGAPPSGPVDYRMIAAPDGATIGGMMRLSQDMANAGATPGWFGYVGVDDVDASVGQVADGGGAVRVGPWSIPGVGRMALVADPHGVPLYVMRGDSGGATSTAFAPNIAGHFEWNELATPDQDAALGFYGALFGWESRERMDMGGKGFYTFLDHGDQRIGAMTTAQDDWPARWVSYVRVPDVNDAAARIAAAGGKVTAGPYTTPKGDRIVIASDPLGAIFGLVGAAA